MSKCYRCKKPVPVPDMKEAIAREQDWREFFPDDDSEERVLICMPCAEELEDMEDE